MRAVQGFSPFDKAMEVVKRVLDQNKNPMNAADVDHKYEDKYALVEFMTNTGIAALLNALEQSLDGFNGDVLQQVVQAVQVQKRSMTLRLTVAEACEFLSEKTVTVESPTSKVITTSPTSGSAVYTHKVMNEVKEFRWRVSVQHSLILFAGSDPAAGNLVLGQRVGTSEVATSMRKEPFMPQTRPPMDLDLTWLISTLDPTTLKTSFSIDRNQAKTPRRNFQVAEAIAFLGNLNQWSSMALQYFQKDLRRVLLGSSKPPTGNEASANSPADWLQNINAHVVFVPILPIFMDNPSPEDNHSDETLHDTTGNTTITTNDSGMLVQLAGLERSDAPVLSLKDATSCLEEQCRSLKHALLDLMGHFPDPSIGTQLISGYEAKLVFLWCHLRDIAHETLKSVDYVENMLKNQLISAIGKSIDMQSFRDFLTYHNNRIFPKDFAPKPFCYAIRQENQYPDGVLSIVEGFGKTSKDLSDPIHTFTRFIPGDASLFPMSIPLNDATTAEFTGNQYLHGWMDTFFANERPSKYAIRARARQFSCFMLVLGTMSGPDQFTPKDAILLQNKDEVIIPLILEDLPSSKEFKDAIQSLSPEQARFAKSFRSMQLGSSVFGLCVIQVKPQLEALLSLPANSLTKEIKLTQDLLSLLIEYQIPPTLVSFDSSESSSNVEESATAVIPLTEKVNKVKEHVKAVMDVVNDIKETELQQAMQRADMRRELRSMQVVPCSASGNFSRCSSRPAAAPTGGSTPRRLPTPDSAASRSSSGTFGAAAVPTGGSTPKPMRMWFSHSMDVSSRGTLGAAAVPTGGSPPERMSRALGDLLEGNDSHAESGNAVDRIEAVDWIKGDRDVDFTAIPKKLDTLFDSYDSEHALRTVTLRAGDGAWTRNRQANLLAKMETKVVSPDDRRTEKNRALDLLDALSRSGSLPISSGELHVMIGVRHKFEENIIDTVIQENKNPIEKVDFSSLLMASMIHQVEVSTLVEGSKEVPTSVLEDRVFPKKAAIEA